MVAAAEGVLSVTDHAELEHARALVRDVSSPERRAMAKRGVKRLETSRRANTFTLAEQLESLTGSEARVSILGYIQCGGSSCDADRLLDTCLGVAGANTIVEGHYGVMVADRGQGTELVPLRDVAGCTKFVPADHEWIQVTRVVETALGD